MTGSLVLIGAFVATVGLILALRPLFVRYAMARPNARSSHREPTPQGGGVAVVAATLALVWLAGALLPAWPMTSPMQVLAVSGAVLLLALVGAMDDIRSLPLAPRLLAQFAAVAAVVLVLPVDARLAPILPLALERALLVVVGVYFVNLVNFMDGIDWITVAEVVPVTGGLLLLGALGALPSDAVLIATALLGAILGFAPFNRPVARLFLGDVGSQPIGLMLGWLLLVLALQGHVAAALLLPLYYLADASLTLTRRVIAREPFWQAHRTHFYQRATDAGFSVPAIVTRIFAVNVALAVLAAISVLRPGLATSLATLALGCVLVGVTLHRFVRGPR
jgi:UDP-N-acetylmuramyl pentapeptide phosphotransferase/UDP-N-acetylglucosamine-1-phosphate transferase